MERNHYDLKEIEIFKKCKKCFDGNVYYYRKISSFVRISSFIQIYSSLVLEKWKKYLVTTCVHFLGIMFSCIKAS